MKVNLPNIVYAAWSHRCGRVGPAKVRGRCVYILILSLALIACKSQPPQQGKRYELKGSIVSVDKAKQSATIAHEEVKDFMDAMTMPFKLKDAWPLDVMKPGDQVQATLVVTEDSAWLEDVVIVQKTAPEGTPPPAGSSSLPSPGDVVPDFRLVNQDGKPVRISQFRGRALLTTFIYTRCPIPEYCTLMSNNFAVIDQELRKDPTLYDRTHLISISFDPEYDTPKVLRSYGASHTGNYAAETFAHWEFATGNSEEIKKLAKYFGFTIIPEKDQIVHSLQTALIGPDGKLAKLYAGNEWKPAEVLSDIRKLLEDSSRARR